MRYRSSIAKITTRLTRGTGALVTDRLVLTALHVVAERSMDPPGFFPGKIQLDFGGEPITATPVEGCWNGLDDWVLLACERAPGVPPIPLGEIGEDEGSVAWEAFGFPDAHPEGIAVAGEVRDAGARYDGRPALQLYSKEAAAGGGMPVKGLSGAPCLVGGALVGVIRSSLLEAAHNVGGVLFACPIGAVLSGAGDRLPIPDPVRGLPGLPAGDLPNQPFRYLDWYTAADAEIFFGRNADIRELYQRIVAPPEDPPIVLFHGQSGVGKSSLLEAGVLPRLCGSHEVRVERRDQSRGLRASFEAAIEHDWRALEARCDRPVLVILDQVEEVFTRPRGDPWNEIDALSAALVPILRSPAARPRGRLVLSLRKEWLPDVEKRLGEVPLPLAKVFLQRLDRAGAIDVVLGLARSKRLQHKYQIAVEEGLAGTIADDLLADPGSPVAPMLQILMTRLYQGAPGDEGARIFNRERYLALKREGLHLADFLRRELDRPFPEPLAPHLASGLVDDLLDAHTTVFGTADTRTRDELSARYPHAGADLDALVGELSRRYLLTHRALDRTRLAHDTLAVPVRERARSSQRPGQRARRILEARTSVTMGQWEGKDAAPELDRLDLQLVEEGRSGMRALTPAEEALLVASRARRAREEAAEEERRAALADAERRRWQAEEERRIEATSRELAAAAMTQIEADPELGILLALEAIDRRETPQAQDALQTTIERSRVRRTMTGHRGKVWGVAWSADGDLLASAGADGTARIWDAHTGACGRTLSGHGGEVTCVAWSPDGARVATGSRDGTARIWDADHGVALATLAADPGGVNSIAWSADGKLLATGGEDGVARIWDVAERHVVLEPGRHDKPILGVAFGPDDLFLATASADNTACVWLADDKAHRWWEERRATARPTGHWSHDDRVAAVTYCLDQNVFLTASYDSTAALAAPTASSGRALAGHMNWVLAVAFSRDGARLATGSADRTARIWRTSDGQVLMTLRGHTDWVTGAGFSPNGREIATSSADGTVRVWDLGADETLALTSHPDRLYIIEFDRTGTRLCTSGDSSAKVWDADTGKELYEAPGETFATFSADGTRLATNAGPIAIVRKIHPDPTLVPPKEVARLSGHERGLIDIAFRPDGRQLATASADGTARVWDLVTPGEPFVLRGHEDWVNGIAYDREGELIVTAGNDRKLRLWRSATGEPVRVLSGHTHWIHGVCFHPDGTKVASASHDCTARVWDVSDGRQLVVFEGHTDWVRDVDISHDGSLVATASKDKSIRLWDAGSGRVLREIRGHADEVWRVAFSPDGRRLASVSWDRTARVWDVASGEELLTLSSDRLRRRYVPFSPDGVATLYRIELRALIDLGRQRVTRALTPGERRRYLHEEVGGDGISLPLRR